MFSKKSLFGIIFLVSLMLCMWSLPSVYGYWMYATKPPFVEDETNNHRPAEIAGLFSFAFLYYSNIPHQEK